MWRPASPEMLSAPVMEVAMACSAPVMTMDSSAVKEKKMVSEVFEEVHVKEAVAEVKAVDPSTIEPTFRNIVKCQSSAGYWDAQYSVLLAKLIDGDSIEDADVKTKLGPNRPQS